MTYRETHDPIAEALARTAKAVQEQRAAQETVKLEEQRCRDDAWALARVEFESMLSRLREAVAPARVRVENIKDNTVDVDYIKHGNGIWLVLERPSGERTGAVVLHTGWSEKGWIVPGGKVVDIEQAVVQALASSEMYEMIEEARRGSTPSSSRDASIGPVLAVSLCGLGLAAGALWAVLL